MVIKIYYNYIISFLVVFSQIKSEDLVSEAIKREKDNETKSDAKKVSQIVFSSQCGQKMNKLLTFCNFNLLQHPLLPELFQSFLDPLHSS